MATSPVPTPPKSGIPVTSAPPLPAEKPQNLPPMESSDVEQAGGKTAIETFKKRLAAEQDAGKAAVERFARSRPTAASSLMLPPKHNEDEDD